MRLRFLRGFAAAARLAQFRVQGSGFLVHGFCVGLLTACKRLCVGQFCFQFDDALVQLFNRLARIFQRLGMLGQFVLRIFPALGITCYGDFLLLHRFARGKPLFPQR